ncbi:MAG: hypothetical protein FWG11_08850 [Promicromonosporaceae bacterium]|nr:hypothetical protein [Promicromonosporaceae bacterium]
MRVPENLTQRSMKGTVMEVLKDFVLGDMIARYVSDGPSGNVGLMLIPASMASRVVEKSDVRRTACHPSGCR